MRYSIAPRFVETVLAGSQDCLIAPARLIGHAEAGEEIELCVGNLRGPPIRRAMCAGTPRLRLVFSPVIEIEIDGEKIPAGELDIFARRCGYADLRNLVDACARGRAREWSGFLLTWENAP